MKKFSGFTLIEMLVSIGVFTILATLILSILFISFRGSKKSEVLTQLKQNGNSALTQMVKGIRYAKSLNTPLSCNPTVTSPSITITSLTDNAQTTFSCPVGASTTITSNSAALVDVTAVNVTGCSFTCTQNLSNSFPTITIKFTLSSNASNSMVENNGSIPFESTVTMRNYHP